MQNLVTSGSAGIRYLTRMYAAVTLDEAKRLAAIDSMPFNKVKQTHNVELLHVHHTELWAWWSDGILTTGLGLKPELCPNVLSLDAEELIHTTCLSISLCPACGWHKLARIKRILKQERLAVGPKRGNYKPEFLTRLAVENVNVEHGKLYIFFSAEGIEDHFDYQVTTDFPFERIKASTITEITFPIEKLQKQENFFYIQMEIAA